MSKFNFTKTINETPYRASIDLDIVWGYTFIEGEENSKILTLHTTLQPVEAVQQVPQYVMDKKTGQPKIVEYRATKVTTQPSIEITIESEIEEFLKIWNES